MFKRFFVCTALLLLLTGAIFSEEATILSSSVDTTDSASIRSPEVVGLKIGKAGEDVNFISDHVGIGTGSPGYKLDVSGTGRFTSALTLTGQTDNADGYDRGSYWAYDNKVAMVLEPAADNGATAILFPSIGNRPSDFAYIVFDEDYGEAGVATGENSALIIGCENDGTGSSDHVRVKSRLVVEADMSSSDPTAAFQVKSSNTTSDLFTVLRAGNVGIGTTSPSYKLDVNGTTRSRSTFYMGSSSGDGDDMYICDRIYDWDNTGYYLDMNSSSRLYVNYQQYCRPWSNGSYYLGDSGNRWGTAYINTLYLNGSGRSSWPSGGGEWTDAGSYLYPNEYSGHRIYESGSYFTYYSGDPNSTNGHYFYNSDNRNGSNYYTQRTDFNGTNYWGNQYSAAVFGRSYLDYDRSSGTFGRDWSGDDWGALGYQRSGGSEYGGYFSGGYTGGGGRRRLGKSFGDADAGMDGKAHIDGGIAAYGDLFGADIHGVIYGTFTEGGRYASYDHGDRYIDGLDVHLTDVGEENMAVAFTNVSPKPVITAAGVGSLDGGRCKVVFDSGFSKQIASGGRIIVTASPLSDCRGIHIENISGEGFTVAENGGGTSNLEFTWIAIAERKGFNDFQLPAEVVSADYTDKIERGLVADGDPSAGDGTGLYFENGVLYAERHPSTIPSEELIALKNEFARDPGSRSYEDWDEAFRAVGEGGIGISREEFDAMLDTPENNPERIPYFDREGRQIPPEWVEELREAGLPMFTYEEMMQRRKQQYLDEARARREAAKRATQP
ncbi:hypothetical protein DRQ19_02810, partial [bacterium]